MKTKQHGFGVVEIIVIIVIIGLLGTIGWLAYDRQKSKSSSEATTTQTNEQSQKTPVKEEVKQPTYFEIKELGVKFEPSDSLNGLYYAMGNNNKTAYFSLNELKDTDCAADKTSQVALTRYTDADFNSDPTASKEQARKIGNYYYLIAGGQAMCDDSDAVQQKADKLRADISKLLPSALVEL